MVSRPGPFDWCAEELGRLEAAGLRRHPETLSSAPGPDVEIAGRPVIQLCSNDYLGLAGNPCLGQAAARAAGRWGAGSGASRLVSGTSELHRRLERALAALKGCEDAIVFSSGYLANTATIPALAGKPDAVFSDAANHASIIDGCRLSGARVVVYRHRDLADLDRALGAIEARRRLVVTDTVFSMDGDLAPLGGLAEVCRRRNAMLMADEAHATGVLGPRGAGALEAAGLRGDVVVMGTLSKALGSAGGFVAGSHELVEYLRNRARGYVFDTAPAPAAMGAAVEALRIVGTEPHRRARVLAAAQRLAGGLAELGYDVLPPAAAIVPVIVGDSGDAVALSARLLAQGVFVPAIRPPSVPDGTARLRVTVTAAHTDDHLATALEAFSAARRARSGGCSTLKVVNPPLLGVNAGPSPIDERIVRAGGVFVTGTGTGVGKTVVAAILAKAVQGRGIKVGALKPAQTGAAEGADDLAFIRAAAGLPGDRSQACYVLETPLAPEVSARLERRQLELGPVLRGFRQLAGTCDLVVVEGAGGLLVPFNETASMADVAAALGLPVLVAALPGLGTLNHTALTVEAARARGLEVIGVVLCGFPDHPGLPEATNPAEIERLTGAPVVGVVPKIPGLDTDRGVFPQPLGAGRWLAPALGGTFDRRLFLERLELTCESA